MKKQYILLVSVFLIAISSCNKKLDLAPTDSIDVTKAFTSVTDLEKGLLGVYSANDQTNKIYIASLLSDETKISNENRGQGQFTFKFQYSSSEGEHNADFAQYYVMIDRLHKVLAAFDGVTATTPADVTKKAKIGAELIALRGIAYYELLIRFMPPGYDANALGVAIVLNSDLTAKPARNTVGEVIAQIETDLAAARADANIPDAPTDVLRISKAAIAAYQARVALLKRDWNSAVTFATAAITLSGKSLATGASFVDYWQDGNESETIWKYRNQSMPQLLWRDTNGDVFFEPSDKLKSQYDTDNDLRFPTYFSSNGSDTSIVFKYPGSALGPTINDQKIIRIAEMYLIRAEANAENNMLAAAAADVNAVRAARIIGYTNVAFSSSTEAIDAVLNERFKELCYEGFRFFDLKRRGLPVNRFASDVQSTNWQNLPANDYHFTLPIPQDEILANPNAVQNPGY
ncbi:MAG: RagB/SusD family nutrient uptake outer membrane protein [Ginsengibacter sp.]